MNAETLAAVLSAKATLAAAEKKHAESIHGIEFYTRQAAKRKPVVDQARREFEAALKTLPPEMRAAFQDTEKAKA